MEPAGVRHSMLAAFACLSLLLIGATPAFTIVPTVIVYPYAASAQLNREDSARIVTTVAEELAAGGKIKVIPAAADVTREKYLSDARAHGASYYVTGLITPLGNGASVVAQVVSVTSGTLVYSTTNYVTSLAEIAAQGDDLRAGIVERSTRGIQAFQAPPPSATAPAPAPPNAAEIDANKLFAHKKGAPEARVPAPDATVGVLTVGGSADGTQRVAAARALADAIGKTGRHAVVVDAPAPSDAVCAANKATTLVAAWLDTPPPNGGADATLRLIGYDCNGKVAYDHTFKQPLATITSTAVDAYLNPKGKA